MEKIKQMAPFLIVTEVAFYVLPLVSTTPAMLNTMISTVSPAVCFIAAMIFGYKIGLLWRFPLLVAVLFIPALLLFYNISAFYYVFIYGELAAIGMFFGAVVYNLRVKK